MQPRCRSYTAGIGVWTLVTAGTVTRLIWLDDAASSVILLAVILSQSRIASDTTTLAPAAVRVLLWCVLRLESRQQSSRQTTSNMLTYQQQQQQQQRSQCTAEVEVISASHQWFSIVYVWAPSVLHGRSLYSMVTMITRCNLSMHDIKVWHYGCCLTDIFHYDSVVIVFTFHTAFIVF